MSASSLVVVGERIVLSLSGKKSARNKKESSSRCKGRDALWEEGRVEVQKGRKTELFVGENVGGWGGGCSSLFLLGPAGGLGWLAGWGGLLCCADGRVRGAVCGRAADKMEGACLE
jgi:hypothetical protein